MNIPDVPQPRFVPQDAYAKRQDGIVVEGTPPAERGVRLKKLAEFALELKPPPPQTLKIALMSCMNNKSTAAVNFNSRANVEREAHSYASARTG